MMDFLHPAQLRLRCLELALSAPGDPVESARLFLAFVTGDDAKTTIERLRAIVADLEAAGVS